MRLPVASCSTEQSLTLATTVERNAVGKSAARTQLSEISVVASGPFSFERMLTADNLSDCAKRAANTSS